MASKKQEFYDRYLDLARDVEKRTGIDHRVVLGQAALESGWGAKPVAKNNLFSIKGKGGSWRTYDSPADAFTSYAETLEHPRYSKARAAKGVDDQLKAIKAAGYATDRRYVAKAKSVVNSLPTGGAAPTTPRRVAFDASSAQKTAQQAGGPPGVSYALGPNRPIRPNQEITSRVLAAAQSVDPSLSVKMISGKYPKGKRYGSPRHGTGDTVDFRIVKNGKELPASDPIHAQVVGALPTHGINEIGIGMSNGGIHAGYGTPNRPPTMWAYRGNANSSSYLVDYPNHVAAVQSSLGVDADTKFGPQTLAALRAVNTGPQTPGTSAAQPSVQVARAGALEPTPSIPAPPTQVAMRAPSIQVAQAGGLPPTPSLPAQSTQTALRAPQSRLPLGGGPDVPSRVAGAAPGTFSPQITSEANPRVAEAMRLGDMSGISLALADQWGVSPTVASERLKGALKTINRNTAVPRLIASVPDITSQRLVSMVSNVKPGMGNKPLTASLGKYGGFVAGPLRKAGLDPDQVTPNQLIKQLGRAREQIAAPPVDRLTLPFVPRGTPPGQPLAQTVDRPQPGVGHLTLPFVPRTGTPPAQTVSRSPAPYTPAREPIDYPGRQDAPTNRYVAQAQLPASRTQAYEDAERQTRLRAQAARPSTFGLDGPHPGHQQAPRPSLPQSRVDAYQDNLRITDARERAYRGEVPTPQAPRIASPQAPSIQPSGIAYRPAYSSPDARLRALSQQPSVPKSINIGGSMVSGAAPGLSNFKQPDIAGLAAQRAQIVSAGIRPQAPQMISQQQPSIQQRAPQPIAPRPVAPKPIAPKTNAAPRLADSRAIAYTNRQGNSFDSRGRPISGRQVAGGNQFAASSGNYAGKAREVAERTSRGTKGSRW